MKMSGTTCPRCCFFQSNNPFCLNCGYDYSFGMNWRNVEHELPEDNTYVLVILDINNHIDSDDQEHVNYSVVKFVRGISLMERENLSDDNPKKKSWSSQDEGFNNKKPYYWSSFGPSKYDGQKVVWWMPLPSHPVTA